MSAPLSHDLDATNLSIQNLVSLHTETSTDFSASAATATSVDVQATAFPQYPAFCFQPHEMTDAADTLTGDDYCDDDTDKSNNSEDNEANTPFKTPDGLWCCGWLDSKKKTRCVETRPRMCDMT
jgi:hypothetical protein